MWALLGLIGSLVMGGLEWGNAINAGWWCITPFVVGIVLQIIAWCVTDGDAEVAGGCFGAGIEAVAEIISAMT